MKTLKQLSLLVIAILLLFQQVPYTVSAATDETSTETPESMTLFAVSGEQTTPLYDDKQENVLVNVPDDSVVTLVDSFDKNTAMTHVTYTDEEAVKSYQGYVATDQLYSLEAADDYRQERGATSSDAETTDDSQETTSSTEEPQAATFSMTTSSVVEQKTVTGVALKDPTPIYASQSTGSKVIKSYSKGSILLYKTLNADWYEAIVYVNGSSTTGFIHRNDVDTATDNPKTLTGYGAKEPTRIYAEPSTSSNTLKSYDKGTFLYYKTFTSDWYEALVYVNGQAITGYIHKSDVEQPVENPETLTGYGLKSPTHIYAEPSTSSHTLKSYEKGKLLYYKTFISDWYEALVYINGQATTGYIHKSDVEQPVENQETLQGIGTRSSTKIFSKTSRNSDILKSYSEGSILYYKTFISDWYEALVYVNGKATNGYIHKRDVENLLDKQESLQGIGSKSPTKIYSKASTSSSSLKSYDQGSVLYYKTFSSNWYEALVYINGKATTGYIYKDDVENLLDKQQSLKGIGTKRPTKVYSKASTNSSSLKSYDQGSVLYYKTFSADWYEAIVYINGKATNGYIHKNDVENITDTPESLQGVALKSPTNIYTKASTSSKILKNYNEGKVLQYKTFTSGWYEALVYINGKATTGYIKNGDVSESVYDITRYNISLDKALDIQMSAMPKTTYSTMYVHKNALKKVDGRWRVDGTNWNVRSGPGTSYDVIGKIDERYVNDRITVYGTEGNWYKFNTWIIATESATERYLDPNNFEDISSTEYFQFLKLSQTAGLNAKEVNENILKGNGILAGKASSFIKAGQDYDINEIYLISHAMLETGNGTSGLANGDKYNGTIVYNMYGIGAADGASSPYQAGLKFAYEQGWTSPEKAIVGGAKFIADRYINAGQDTLYKMRWNPDAMDNYGYASHQYATDIGWAVKQTSRIEKFYNMLEKYSLVYDIPFYK
ncbi:hypothetical protein Pryu01_00847 [Paraliobacillus ryukyuensis]|uniref:Beta-N-acetylglucosaminidase n=1 Tax=Paraliobacillus ryukyuensis TaxID=200904 RepID=A0A366EFR5_9BACI|nr:N-acetylglucosaminidase [Paraliobacillus ryukyuensis]RBP00580.1 beta-N-acetylglucosaminidase [Paraliobacillus ryukyuensis]